MRRGEICGPMWSDFDGKKGTLTVRRTLRQRKGGGLATGETKTGKGRRTITLPPSTAQLLRERQKRSCSHWIFPNPLCPESPVSPGNAYNHMKTLLKNAGLPRIRFHDLRPTADRGRAASAKSMTTCGRATTPPSGSTAKNTPATSTPTPARNARRNWRR